MIGPVKKIRVHHKMRNSDVPMDLAGTP